LGVASSTVHGVVWYPADGRAKEAAQTIGDPSAPLFEAGNAATNAKMAASPERFPLILVSHGTGGSAEQMAWLGTRLARAGFIAVAIDQSGNTAREKTVQGFTLWWLRARALSRALDAVLADPSIGPHVDRARVGVAGFSIGGYTAIALAGARVDLTQLAAYCATHSDDGDKCEVPEFPGLAAKSFALQKSDPAYARAIRQSGGSVADVRVRAVYAIAPAAGQSVTTQSLRTIDVPVRIAYGTADAIVDPEQNALRYARDIPKATILAVPGAGHYTFLDTCTATAAATLGFICTDGPSVGRDAVHDRVSSDAIAFFTRTLR
jgi:predicted dienelactone hydrolase